MIVKLNVNNIFESCPNKKQLKISNNKNYSVHVIHSEINESVDTHYHKNWSESWYIIEGSFKVWIDDGNDEFIAEPGDFIHIDEKVKHRIETISDTAKRLAIFRDDVEIIYDGN